MQLQTGEPLYQIMLARYYEAGVGRFLSTDPAQKIRRRLTNPQRWNRYAYVLNNPLVSIDPDGQTDIYVFRPENTSSSQSWRAIQAEAPAHGNTVTIYNGKDATVSRFTDALSKSGSEVVFSGHSVFDGSTHGSVHLANGDVGTVTANKSPVAATAVPAVAASSVGAFGCQTQDLQGQYASTNFTSVNSGGDKETSLKALDNGAAAYTDSLARDRDDSSATDQATKAIQKSGDPQDKNGDKAVLQKKEGT